MSDPPFPDAVAPNAARGPAANHYQLLGLKLFEADADSIRSAADRALAKLEALRRTQPDLHQQWADELTLARLCLTNPARKAQYDALLRQRQRDEALALDAGEQVSAADVPAAARRNQLRAPAAPAKFEPRVDHLAGDLMPPARGAPSTGTVSSGAAPANELPGMFVNAAPPTAAPPVFAPLPVRAVAASPFAIAAPAIENVAVPMAAAVVPAADAAPAHDIPWAESGHATEAAANADGDEYLLPGRITRRRPRTNSAGPGAGIVIAAIVAIGGVMVAVAWRNPPVPDSSPHTDVLAKRRDIPTKPAFAPAAAPSTPENASDTKHSTARANPVSPKDKPPTDPPIAAAHNVVPAPATANGPPKSSEPDPKQKNAFDQALRSARSALGGRAIDRARRELKAAQALTQSPADETRLAAVETLADAVEQFWQAVWKAVASLNAADELSIAGQVVSVVETGAAEMIIHAEGANHTYTTANMPAPMATALATRWLDEKAGSTAVVLGAFQAVDPAGSVVEAKAHWQLAKARGESVAELLPLLDEITAAPQAERTPTPAARELNLASKTLKARYAAEYRQAARSRDAKRELAETLLANAPGAPDAAARFVLFREARELAVGAADAGLVSRIIDAWSAGFEINLLLERQEGLKKVVNTVDAAGAAAATRTILELVDRAAADGQSDSAAQLCRLAAAAARKSRDAALIAQAAEREKSLLSPK